jgi:cyclophilin family peptidyl-prolyl cis-trans isomerase
MKLSKSIELLKDNNYKGWIFKKSNPKVIIEGKDFFNENGETGEDWCFEKITDSYIKDGNLHAQIECVTKTGIRHTESIVDL